MKSLIHEAEQAPGVGAQFVSKARTVADKLDIPVEWLLAAMSWETTQYNAYHVDTGTWARNTTDGGGGLVGFTPFTPSLQKKTPFEQLDDVETYLRNTIKNFKIPTPFASAEDFYCVIYAPGISGKPDSYSWTYQGTTYVKKERMDVYRGHLAKYDMPETGDELDGADGSFLTWAPGETKKIGWAKTTDDNVAVQAGPGRNFAVVKTLANGSRIQVIDQIRGAEFIEGNAKWDRIAAGFVSDSQVEFE